MLRRILIAAVAVTTAGLALTATALAANLTATATVPGGSLSISTSAIAYPFDVPAGSTAPTAAKLFNSALGAGGTVTIAIVSGP
jgi:hypothetical protein